MTRLRFDGNAVIVLQEDGAELARYTDPLDIEELLTTLVEAREFGTAKELLAELKRRDVDRFVKSLGMMA